MSIEQVLITDQIRLLVFPNQDEITRTFVRPQEFFENPEFRGKVGFTIDEFEAYQAKTEGDPNFYYSAWNGFNIPGKILAPFYEGKFDPLSSRETRLLGILEDLHESGDPFYVIGVHIGSLDKVNGVLRHEVAHGLYETSPSYTGAVD